MTHHSGAQWLVSRSRRLPALPRPLALRTGDTEPHVYPAPLGTSVAALEVTSFKIGAAQSGAYYPKVILRETSGLSDARLTSLDFQAPGGEVNRISRYADRRLHSLIRWYRQAGAGTWRRYPVYCREVDSPSPIVELQLTVRFTDRQGRPGVVTATATP